MGPKKYSDVLKAEIDAFWDAEYARQGWDKLVDQHGPDAWVYDVPETEEPWEREE